MSSSRAGMLALSLVCRMALAAVRGLVDDPFEYPHSSAWHFARTKGPPWLERGWVEDVVRRDARTEQYSPTAYRSTLGARPTRGRLRIVLPRLSAPATEDDLDDLLGAAPMRLREWFRRRAIAADGMSLRHYRNAVTE